MFILVPAILLGLLFHYFLHESPRFLICKGKNDEAYLLIDEIGRFNNPEYKKLSSNDKDRLALWGR